MDWTASVVDVMLAECRQLQASTAIAEVQSMISGPNLRNSPTVKKTIKAYRLTYDVVHCPKLGIKK